MEIKVGHLYGNLMNTYGDNGNLLMLFHRAKLRGLSITSEIISLDGVFDHDRYDFLFFGGGQDYEQHIVARDIQGKKAALSTYIENGGVCLAICGGYQLLGQYYINAQGERIDGAGVLDFYTEHQEGGRLVGELSVHNENLQEEYHGFENHSGATFLGDGLLPLGMVVTGHGNNGQDQTEGLWYKNTIGSYFHGPLLVRNIHLADRLLDLIVARKTGASGEV